MLLQWRSRVIWIRVIVLYTCQWVEDEIVTCFSFWLLLLWETVTDHLFPTSCPPDTCLTFLNTSMNLFGSPLPFFSRRFHFFVAFFSTPSQQKWIDKYIFAFSITMLISHFVSFNLCFPSNVPISFSLSFLLQTSLKSHFVLFHFLPPYANLTHQVGILWIYFKYPCR